jgi:uncharacterized membrane protein
MITIFHPAIVHFAIALLLVGPAMDTAGLLLRREALLLTGKWNTVIGAAMLVLAELSGLSATSSLSTHSAAGQALLNLHTALGHLCLLLWIPIAVWRAVSQQLIPKRARTIYLTLGYTGAALMLSQAALGAALVYRHGVGLSAAARQEPMLHESPPPEVVDHAHLPKPKVP